MEMGFDSRMPKRKDVDPLEKHGNRIFFILYVYVVVERKEHISPKDEIPSTKIDDSMI